MNETLKTIMERYSCRDYDGAPLTGGQIQAIADAALAAPSAVNRQPWHVIIITDKSLIDELDEDCMSILAAAEDKTAFERMMSRGGKVYYNAPCLVLVASDGSSYASMDCGILSQNVALAAHSLGLASVICGMAGMPLSGPRREAWRKRMQIPEGYQFGIGVLVGAAKSGQKPHDLNRAKVTYVS